MAEGELNVDSLISRLLEGEQLKRILVMLGSAIYPPLWCLVRLLFSNYRGLLSKRGQVWTSCEANGSQS